MINLLPEQAKKKLVRDRLSRLLLIFGIILLGMFISGSALALLTLISINLQRSELLRELEAAKKSTILERVEEVEVSIRKANERLKVFSKNLSRENRVSSVLKAVLGHRRSSIFIEELAYNGPTEFRLHGIAGTRDDLLVFTKHLNDDDLIGEVDSPISNLLKNRDIEFSLSFEVLPETINEAFANKP